jgi:ferritin-like metal-binding protein YciE
MTDVWSLSANPRRWLAKRARHSSLSPANMGSLGGDESKNRSANFVPPLQPSWNHRCAGQFGFAQPWERLMAKTKTLHDLFHDTLKDIYFAEKKILGALPKMAKAAQSKSLRAAFEKHRGETETQIDRLEQVFELIEARPQGKTCDAIVGIIEEAKEVMSEYKGEPALDAGLLAAAQAVEHYEISRYGTLATWADELGLKQASKLLKATLAEEEKTDGALSDIAKSEVNLHAANEGA